MKRIPPRCLQRKTPSRSAGICNDLHAGFLWSTKQSLASQRTSVLCARRRGARDRACSNWPKPPKQTTTTRNPNLQAATQGSRTTIARPPCTWWPRARPLAPCAGRPVPYGIAGRLPAERCMTKPKGFTDKHHSLTPRPLHFCDRDRLRDAIIEVEILQCIEEGALTPIRRERHARIHTPQPERLLRDASRQERLSKAVLGQ